MTNLEALIERLTRERDKERKHVSKLMNERDQSRSSLRQANERIISMRLILENNRAALDYASQCLDGITAIEDEDATPDGYSKTCREAKCLVDSASKATLRALRSGELLDKEG